MEQRCRKLPCAVRHHKGAHCICGGCHQRPRPSLETKVKFSALGGSSIEREGITSRDINAATKVGIPVIVEHHPAVRCAGEVNANSAASMTRARRSTTESLIAPNEKLLVVAGSPSEA